MQATSSITLGFIAQATKSQLAVAVSMAFEMKPQLGSKEFKVTDYARRVALDSHDGMTEKTAANYASVAKKLCLKFDNKLGIYSFTSNDVLLFVNFLASEVAAAGYTSSLDDIGRFCDGKLSIKSERDAKLAAAAAAEAKRIEAEAAAEAAKLESTDVQLQQAEAAAAEAQAKREAAEAEAAANKEAAAAAEAEAAAAKEAAALMQAQAAEAAAAAKAEAQAQAAAAEAEAAAAKAEAEAMRKEAESTCVTVKVDAAGKPVITLADNMSPAFLEEVAKQLKAAAAAMRKDQKLALAA